MQFNVMAQNKNGMENYSFFSSKNLYVWVPVIHHSNNKNRYMEVRYNYEALRTASVYAGQSFHKKSVITYTVTPMLGIVMGAYNGASLATNIELEYKKAFVSMQSQYTVNKNEKKMDFFFNWTEFAYQPVKWFYAGISMQQTKTYRTIKVSEYGILLGFLTGKFTIPVYVFEPLSSNRNLVIGINTEW